MIIKQTQGPLFQVSNNNELRVRTQALVITDSSVVKLDAGALVDTPKAPELGDYDVLISKSGTLKAVVNTDGLMLPDVIGGAHFSPGGCAPLYDGGDSIPQFNPFSSWDLCFRPCCQNPRGMALIAGRFWVDIWPMVNECEKDRKFRTGINAFVATEIAHRKGKTLPSEEEFHLLALGVRERSSNDTAVYGPKLDAPRTSQWGIMHATGNLWIWLRIISDPTDNLSRDKMRAGIAGGHWVYGADCGSRCSNWYFSPWFSDSFIGARGRCDHLNLA
jgi:hypothetical protein